VLISGKGYRVGQLQNLFGVGRDTASLWIKHYEQSGLEGLLARPRSGSSRAWSMRSRAGSRPRRLPWRRRPASRPA
jgi:transposase